jgi:hypothetical protein
MSYALTNIKHDGETIAAGTKITDQLPEEVIATLTEVGAIGEAPILDAPSASALIAERDAEIAELKAQLGEADDDAEDE